MNQYKPTVGLPMAGKIEHPEFIRLPKSGKHCELTGMSRSALNELLLPRPGNKHCPPVKSVSLRRPGTLTGVRLIVVKSLLDYLYSHAQGGTN